MHRRPTAPTIGCDVSLYWVAPTAISVTFYANHGQVDTTPAKVPLADPHHLPDRTGHAPAPGHGRLVAELGAATKPVALSTGTCGVGCASRTLVRGLTWPVPVAPFKYAGSNCDEFSEPTTGAVSTAVACVAVDLQVVGARDNAGTSVTSTVFMPNSVIGR